MLHLLAHSSVSTPVTSDPSNNSGIWAGPRSQAANISSDQLRLPTSSHNEPDASDMSEA